MKHPMQPTLTANDAWAQLISDLLNAGPSVQPVVSAGRRTSESLAYQVSFDMRYPLVTVVPRKLSYKYAFGEAWWILEGRNDVESIARYNKRIAAFSDDGKTFFGAYGPQVMGQMDYVVNELARDIHSRRAIMNIWRANPPQSKDYPCTMTIQFLVRGEKLHCIDVMRSSDAWLGWPYDVFSFSMVASYVLLCLKARGISVELGWFTLFAGSQHLYDDDRERAIECMEEPSCLAYYPFDPMQFDCPTSLVEWLKAKADGKVSNYTALKEISILPPP